MSPVLDEVQCAWDWQYEHGNYLVRLLEAAGGTVEFLSKTASSIPAGMSIHA